MVKVSMGGFVRNFVRKKVTRVDHSVNRGFYFLLLGSLP